MKHKFLVVLHAYIRNSLWNIILKNKSKYYLFFLTYTSTDNISPALYLKKFVITTICSGRMTNEKLSLAIAAIYLKVSRSTYYRCILNKGFKNADTLCEVHTCISKNVSQQLFLVNPKKVPLELN